jgi:hypothetical protein
VLELKSSGSQWHELVDICLHAASQARDAPSLSYSTINSPHVRWWLDLRYELKGNVRQANESDDAAGNGVVPVLAHADGADEGVD